MASVWVINFVVNIVCLLLQISSSKSFVWFQKFEAPLEVKDDKIPKIKIYKSFSETLVNLVEMRNRIIQNKGIGEKIENGVKHCFIIHKYLFFCI